MCKSGVTRRLQSPAYLLRGRTYLVKMATETTDFEEVTRQFGLAFHDHLAAETSYTQLLRYLNRTNGLEPLNSSFQEYLDELEAEVERTRRIYEEKFDDLVEAIRKRRDSSHR